MSTCLDTDGDSAIFYTAAGSIRGAILKLQDGHVMTDGIDALESSADGERVYMFRVSEHDLTDLGGGGILDLKEL